MSIRARLAIGVAVVLAVAFALFGTFLVRSTRATLLDQVDDRLVEVSYNAMHRKGPNSYGSFGPPSGFMQANDYQDSSPRSVAEYVFNQKGECTFQTYTGYSNNPDPDPEFPAFPSPEADALVGEIVTMPSVDGSLDYRVLIQLLDQDNDDKNDDTYVAVAAPLDEVDHAVSRVVRTVSFGATGVLAISAVASWVLIRRGFRPVDRMVDTAAAIAHGDLSRRVPDGNPRTELGRLGEALNDMLGQIEHGVSARAANEERLRRFVADAAHELRTPLTSVRGYAELYRQGALTDDAALTKAMGRIEAEGGRMARLVDDLLLLARLDRQVSLEFGRVDLGELAREAVEDFRIISPNHPVDLEVAGAVAVSGDGVRLRQVIDNLLTNVGVHTPAGTAVHVRVRRDDGFALVTVADEGPGIPAEDRPHVFERFWRGDPSRVRKTGGTGLGLAIVSSLAQAHGGSVALASGAGTGSEFTVRIPIQADIEDGLAPERAVISAQGKEQAQLVLRPEPATSA